MEAAQDVVGKAICSRTTRGAGLTQYAAAQVNQLKPDNIYIMLTYFLCVTMEINYINIFYNCSHLSMSDTFFSYTGNKKRSGVYPLYMCSVMLCHKTFCRLRMFLIFYTCLAVDSDVSDAALEVWWAGQQCAITHSYDRHGVHYPAHLKHPTCVEDTGTAWQFSDAPACMCVWTDRCGLVKGRSRRRHRWVVPTTSQTQVHDHLH